MTLTVGNTKYTKCKPVKRQNCPIQYEWTSEDGKTIVTDNRLREIKERNK